MAAAILEGRPAERATLRYFCSPYRQGSPLHPCAQQIEWAAGFAREDTNEVKLDKLERSARRRAGAGQGAARRARRCAGRQSLEVAAARRRK